MQNLYFDYNLQENVFIICDYSLIRKGKFLLIERKCELLDYEDIDSGTQFQSILKAMKYLGTIQFVRIDDL